jgi:hypothetical protein
MISSGSTFPGKTLLNSTDRLVHLDGQSTTSLDNENKKEKSDTGHDVPEGVVPSRISS